MAWQLHNIVTPTVTGRRSLHFEEMESLQDHSTMQEADELIHRWLAGVESATSARLDMYGGSEVAHVTGEAQSAAYVIGGAQSDDFLSSVDWVSGDVGQSTKSVLRGLLSKDLDSEIERQTTSKKKTYNPLVTMEMRHKEVKHRRDLREKKRLEKEERKKLSELAHEEAKALVMEEERRAKARAEKEEKMVEQQMKALRKELRERERLTKQLALEKSLVDEEEMVEQSKDEAVMMEAEKFVMSERKRVATRMELVRQLGEAEVKETKENVKLLHRCFQSWWGEVMRGRGKLAKAVAVRDWRLVLRVWKSWAGFVRENRERKAREEVARCLQREKWMAEVAMEHCAYRILKRSLWAWHRVTRQANTERRQKEAKQSYRAKMAAFLQVASAKAEEQKNKESQESPSKDQLPSGVGHTSTAPSKDQLPSSVEHTSTAPLRPEGGSSQTKTQTNENTASCRDHSCDHVHEDVGKSGSLAKAGRSHGGRSHVGGGVKNHVSPKSSRNVPPSSDGGGVIWKKAKKQLDELLSQVDAPPTTTPTPPVGVATTQITLSQPRRPKPKPATKQLAMTAAMERRSADIAKRRLAREQRREALSREKAELLAKEDEEQRRAEAAERDARLKQKREERRLAKQREMEKLLRQKILAELNDKATAHYRSASLKWRGVWPWRKFVREVKKQRHEADTLREKVIVKKAWTKWNLLSLQREMERDAIAVGHYQKSLLKKGLAAWIKVREVSCEIEAMAEHLCPRLLLRRTFRGWSRVVREEREVEWEKVARARRFRQRQVQCNVLKAWRAFVPLSKEERERERRKAELRRKVASWLDDYQPSAGPPDVNNIEQ